MEKMKKRCQATFMDGYHSRQCSRSACIEREGKVYCKQHDPVAVKARDDARSAKWQARMSEAARKNKRRRFEEQALAGIPDEHLSTLMQEVRAVLECEDALDLPHGAGRAVLESHGWDYVSCFDMPASEFVRRKRHALLAKLTPKE